MELWSTAILSLGARSPLKYALETRSPRSLRGPQFLSEGPLKNGFCQRATLLKRFKYEIYIYIYIYKYSTASEQPGFLLFSVQTETIFKILRKIEKIKTRHSRESNHGSPAFRASALTIRLPWHVLILSILAPYGLLSAFAFFKQRILKMSY